MDLVKIGLFIKERRKFKNLTQVQLAIKLGVSEKTISKWECGNGFPDSTLILPLCKALDITANELLSGKLLHTSEEYRSQAEQNLVILKANREKDTRLLLSLELVIGILSSLVLMGCILVGSLVDMLEIARILIIVLGILIFIVGVHFCLLIEKDAGFYMCKKCKHTYIPTFKQIYMAMHMGRTRFIKCPKCGKRSWSKKVIKGE